MQLYYHFKQEYKFDFIHLADVHAHDPAKLFHLFDNDLTDIIVFNWDSINNDSIYGSDTALKFFQHHKLKLHKWVKSGGVVIVEAQAASWKLSQDSYNVFSEKIRVTTKSAHREDIILSKEHLTYPILTGVTKFEDNFDSYIRQPKTGQHQGSWFPDSIKSRTIEQVAYCNRMLSTGWFDRYPYDWIPLMFVESNSSFYNKFTYISNWVNNTSRTNILFRFLGKSIDIADDFFDFLNFKSNKKPVMLAKRVETKSQDSNTKYGAYIVTCMYLGVYDSDRLTKNLLSLPSLLKDARVMKKIDLRLLKAKYKNNMFYLGSLSIIAIGVIIFYKLLTTFFIVSADDIKTCVTIFSACLVIYFTVIQPHKDK